MALFDSKNFNGAVFGAYVDAVKGLKRDTLIKSKAIVEKPGLADMMKEQVGGNYHVTPIKAPIGGNADNYDGNTNISASSRETFTQGRTVIGRAKAWTEKDFATDVTGEDFMPAVEEIARWWDDVDQATILSELAGIFSMVDPASASFVNGHTLDITEAVASVFDETTLNTAVQKALGDKKSKFALAFMHSAVSTNLENLKLVNHAKFTDKDGITKDITLYTLNGRPVLVDDDAPVSSVVVTPETKGVYTLTISTAGAEGDKITIDGVTYTVGEATSFENKTIAVGSSANTQATALKTVLASQFGGKFTVTSSTNKVILTQVVGGTGAIPTVSVTQAETDGAMAATIAQTTAGVAEVRNNAYTTYVLGEGAFEYTNCGVKVPYEMARDPKTNGGEDTMYTRQRKCFAPVGISFTNAGLLSPTDAQLANGANWALANNNNADNPVYYPEKAIPIARIISLG